MHRKQISQKVGQDISGGVGQPERANVDAYGVLHGLIPEDLDRDTHEDARQDVGDGLGKDNDEHDNGCNPERPITNSKIEGENGTFDCTQASVVEDRTHENSLVSSLSLDQH